MEDDLSQKIDQLLNSPDGMEKIRNTMAALGISAEPPSPAPPTIPAPNADNNMLSGLLGLAPLLKNMGQEDNNTALLKALRPYLHNGREKRLDESLKLLQLLKLLPLIQGGLFHEQ